MSKLNLKDRLEDGELDLSMSDLEEVPVKEIISIKKAKCLDLSNNRITKLTKNFASMTHIVKLDLGKNLLTELPENFGDMSQLRHLDLYSNQIDRLPLSFGRLKNLRWLDLKGNPLVPKLAEVAGPCLDAAECAKCARAVVTLLHNMAVTIEEEKARRDQQRQLQQQTEALAQAEGQKKESKKKRKGKGEHLDNAKKGNALANKKGGNEKDMQKQLNGSGHKGKHLKEQRKARSFGACAYMFLFLGLMLAIAGLALFFVDESLFWSYAKSSEVFCKDTFNSTRVWWETKGLQGVKDWAGGGLLMVEAAKRTVLQLYASVSSQIPIYVESAKKMF